MLVLSGWLSFPPEAVLGSPSALWMVSLWAGFAATLGHSLEWLQGRLRTAAVLGSVAGPLAYLAGERFGAMTIETPLGVLAVAILYGSVTPAFLILWRRMLMLSNRPKAVLP